jgi:hypothetical protein
LNESESMWVHFISIGIPIILSVVGTTGLAAWHLSKKIGSFTTLFREYRPHLHAEKDGGLKVEGVIYPRTKLNGD